MLASGAAYRMRGKAATDAADQWAERESGMRLQDYYNWKNRKGAAAQSALSVGQQDLNQLMQFINNFRGGGTTTGTSSATPSTMGMIFPKIFS
jgi:hypothetical protein